MESVLAGPAGVFALTPTERNLRRMTPTNFAPLGQSGPWDRIFAVAADLLWMSAPDGRLAAVDAKTGAVRFRSTVFIAQADVSAIDPKSGDVAFVRGEEFHLLHADDGRDEVIRTR